MSNPTTTTPSGPGGYDPPEWNIVLHPSILTELQNINSLERLNEAREMAAKAIAGALELVCANGLFDVRADDKHVYCCVTGTIELVSNDGEFFPLGICLEIFPASGTVIVNPRKDL
jgi:hypothetical protein